MGRRVHPTWTFWVLDVAPAHVIASESRGRRHAFTYNPFGAHALRAMAWLWERCKRIEIDALGAAGWMVTCTFNTGMAESASAIGATPEEAVARIIADWPREEGT